MYQRPRTKIGWQFFFFFFFAGSQRLNKITSTWTIRRLIKAKMLRSVANGSEVSLMSHSMLFCLVPEKKKRISHPAVGESVVFRLYCLCIQYGSQATLAHRASRTAYYVHRAQRCVTDTPSTNTAIERRVRCCG